MQSIAIVGCGWIGTQLASALIEKGHRVLGTTTRVEKIASLNSIGVNAEILDLAVAPASHLRNFLACADAVVITVPPRPEYPQMLARVADAARDKTIIFTSSISVYEKNGGEVDEVSPIVDSPISRAERTLQNATILRLGGLLGPNRHPVNHLAGRTGLADPEAPVNLVHSHDVVRAVVACLDQNIEGKIINVVAPLHPTRAEYYRSQAMMRGLEPPQFAQAGDSGKIVRSKHIGRLLGFTPDPHLIQ